MRERIRAMAAARAAAGQGVAEAMADVTATRGITSMPLYVDVHRIHNELAELGIGRRPAARRRTSSIRSTSSTTTASTRFAPPPASSASAAAAASSTSAPASAARRATSPTPSAATSPRSNCSRICTTSRLDAHAALRPRRARRPTCAAMRSPIRCRSGGFDAVVSWLAIHHIPRPPAAAGAAGATRSGRAAASSSRTSSSARRSSPSDATPCAHALRRVADRAPTTYAHDLDEAGFEEIEIDRHDRELGDVLPRRAPAFRRDLDRHVRVHGEETAARLERFFSTVDRLFASAASAASASPPGGWRSGILKCLRLKQVGPSQTADSIRQLGIRQFRAKPAATARSGDARRARALRRWRHVDPAFGSDGRRRRRGGPSVVQVHGRRRPASGVVYADNVVLDDGARARPRGRRPRPAARRRAARRRAHRMGSGDVAWRCCARTASTLPPLAPPARRRASATSRSRWRARGATRSRPAPASSRSSAARCAPAAGAPSTEVIRTTAPMHDGFAGGAFVDTDGRAASASRPPAEIRGLGVVIPADDRAAQAATPCSSTAG